MSTYQEQGVQTILATIEDGSADDMWWRVGLRVADGYLATSADWSLPVNPGWTREQIEREIKHWLWGGGEDLSAQDARDCERMSEVEFLWPDGENKGHFAEAGQ
ncbi:MAG TPA: hypothetical protein VFG83_16840 [Kofleriaceae bacterium]|nr:hypothetical protein [Kofleriaceae bacterium]